MKHETVCFLLLALFAFFSTISARKIKISTDAPATLAPYEAANAELALKFAMAAYCSGYLGRGVANWTCPTCKQTPGMQDILELYNFVLDANGYIGYHSKLNKIVIGFSGTNPTAIRDWIDDLDFFFTDYPPCFKNSSSSPSGKSILVQKEDPTEQELKELEEARKFNKKHLNVDVLSGSDQSRSQKKKEASGGCRVHEGFYRTYLGVASTLKTHIDFLLKKYPQVNQVMITGHSLGGAMAVHAAVDMVVSVRAGSFSRSFTVDTLYTFGQPRVGDPDFVAFFDTVIPDSMRVTHWADPVPHLPPKFFGFVHNPEEIWYDSKSDKFINCERSSGEDGSCADSLFGWDVLDHLTYLAFSCIDNYLSCRI